jgi:ribosome-associated protein
LPFLWASQKMIKVSEKLTIEESDIQFDFVRSSGPGGQNINKVSSAVQLRFNTFSTSLPGKVRARLQSRVSNRINEKGELIIQAGRYRSQEKNRQDALQRLIAMIKAAEGEPKKRIKTEPSRSSQERRLEEKHRRSQTKQERQESKYPY